MSNQPSLPAPQSNGGVVGQVGGSGNNAAAFATSTTTPTTGQTITVIGGVGGGPRINLKFGANQGGASGPSTPQLASATSTTSQSQQQPSRSPSRSHNLPSHPQHPLSLQQQLPSHPQHPLSLPPSNAAPVVQNQQVKAHEWVKILLHKRQTGTASPQELAALQKFQQQQMMNMMMMQQQQQLLQQGGMSSGMNAPAINSTVMNPTPAVVMNNQQMQPMNRMMMQSGMGMNPSLQQQMHLQQMQQSQMLLQQQRQAQQRILMQQQQQQAVQQKMLQAQSQARGASRTSSRLSSQQQAQQQQQQQQPLQQPQRPTLGPAQNTYGPRIQKGGTGLVINISAPEPVQARAATRRGRFTEEYFSDQSEGTSESDEVTDSEDEDQLARRQAKRELKSAAAASRGPKAPAEVAPFMPRKRTRLLMTTRAHEYDKMHVYQMDQISGAKEVLVPISVEIDIDASYKFQDSFSWNINEPSMTPEKFAEYICLDLNLNPHQHQGSIARSIKGQLEEYKKYFLFSDLPIPQDTRTIIKLDITVGKVVLRDRFEWDMSSDLDPEEFAAILVSDLQLGGEFISLVAHSIREQLYKIKSSGEFDPSFAIEKPFRGEGEAKSWAPFIDCGDKGDEVFSIEEDRKQRLLKRQLRVSSSNRRGAGQRGYFSTDDPSSSTVPIIAGAPALQSALTPEERAAWRCTHCCCSYTQTPSLFKGPKGENTLCRSCGMYFEEDGQSLPDHRFEMFKVQLS